MRAYADSSFIVNLYIVDPEHSDRAVDYMDRFREALPYTPFHRLEVRNAIRLMVWSKRISTVERAKALKDIEQDLDAGLFLIHTAIDYTDSYRTAERLGADRCEELGTRSSDLFHVAIAMELGFKTFLTFDQKQIELARAAGLKVDF